MARKNRFNLLIDDAENAYFKESGTNRSEWLETLNVGDIVGVLYDGAISEPYRVERMTKHYIFLHSTTADGMKFRYLRKNGYATNERNKGDGWKLRMVPEDVRQSLFQEGYGVFAMFMREDAHKAVDNLSYYKLQNLLRFIERGCY